MNIDVCLATDANYLKYMATTMLSILRSKKPDETIHFHILCDNLSSADKNYVSSQLERFNPCISFVDVDINEFKSFPAGGSHISNTTYFRYKIAELLPSVHKIIYLDCDIIVIGSLRSLFDFNLNGNLIAGVEDVGVTVMRMMSNDRISNIWSHYNAGVLLMDLDRFRIENLFQKFMDYTRTHSVIMADQEVINAVCSGSIAELPFEYNVQDSFFRWDTEVRANPRREEIKAASKNPLILHYTCYKKPWNDFSMPQTDKWFDAYLELTTNCANDDLRNKIIKFRRHQKIFPTVAIKRLLWKILRLTRYPRWEIGKLLRPHMRAEYEMKLKLFCMNY